MSPSLSVAPAHLLHLAVAYDAPELVALDALIARPTPAARLPAELLLHVRAHLLPALVRGVHVDGAAALVAFEAAGADRLCGECIEYNAQVFGPAAWDWPNFVAGCDCPRPAAAAPAPVATRPRAGSKAPRCRREWLVEHLGAQLVSARSAWDAADTMLASVGCAVTRSGACAHEAEEPRVTITGDASALRRATVEFCLDGEEVSAPSDHQEAARPFTTPAKDAAAFEEAPARNSGVSLFGAAGLAALGLALGVAAAHQQLRAMLANERAAGAVACAAGFAVALRVGAALAA